MSVIYLTEEGSVLKKDGYRVVVTLKEEVIKEIPMRRLNP